MSDRSAQAQRYAQAAFQAMLEQWQSTLEEVQAALASDRQLYGLVTDGTKDFAEREKALESVLPKGAPNELGNMLRLMLQEGDLDKVVDVSQALGRLGSSQREPTRADVMSAVELSEEEQESIRASLNKQYGEDLLFTFRVNPALMGGFRIRVGDRLIDTSVASRLAALRESLSSAVR
jgi:F-type H+-transporting ATPase subunit delta